MARKYRKVLRRMWKEDDRIDGREFQQNKRKFLQRTGAKKTDLDMTIPPNVDSVSENSVW